MAARPDVPRDWYKRSFGALYLLAYAHRDEEAAIAEVAALLDLLDLGTGARVLDLCCGSGRHLEAIVSSGMNAVGLDLSAELLAVGARRPRLASRLVKGDLRALPFRSSFLCVLNLFTSFGYFSSDRENEAALADMARVLAPGGVFVVDHMNRPWIQQTLVPHSEERIGDGTLVQDRWLAGNRVEKEITWVGDDGSSHRLHESVRVYGAVELRDLLREQGLVVTHAWGTFSGAPLTESSPRMIVTARKEGC
jgi:SAM-dependent methyltransferase